MKISLNCAIVDGPWGGGNRFLRSLVKAVEDNGNKVVFNLEDDDIDIIMLVDPRVNNPEQTYRVYDILKYIIFRNRRTIVVHRINECDERKNTISINFRLKIANYCADHTVFVGSWMRNLNVWQKGARSSVILNGADSNYFFPMKNRQPFQYERALSLVTHHWGGNWMKGFDIYEKLDRMLERSPWRESIKFTYIGNLPSNFKFKNVNYLNPLHDENLANELRRHDAYITASINEPGGNHQNEGALCGLPILFRQSGCLPEYCDKYGASFNEYNFEEVLINFYKNYPTFLEMIKDYPHTSDSMCIQYLDLFKSLINSREEILKLRNIFRRPIMLILCMALI